MFEAIRQNQDGIHEEFAHSMSIKISLNGKPQVVDDDFTVSRLLAQRDIRPEVVAVEINEQTAPRDQYDSTVLREGDDVWLIYYMGGGRSAT